MTAVTVWVPGRPAPQGSKKYMGRPGGKGVLVESSKALAPWRADVRDRLLSLPAGQRSGWPLPGAVSIRLGFVMPRPTNSPKTRTPPATKRPDLSKLTRAVEDAIGSAGVWRDDAQIVESYVSKRLAERDEVPGVHIFVQQLETLDGLQ